LFASVTPWFVLSFGIAAETSQLDIQVSNGEKYLEKYGLKANDAILAEDKHMPMCVSLA
jgi:hypothetical protein